MGWRSVRLILAESLAGSRDFSGGSGRVHWIFEEREVTFFLEGFLDFPLPSLSGLVFPGWPLPVDFEACVILPLMPLNTYPTHWHPVSPYTEVGGPHHCDDNSTP